MPLSEGFPPIAGPGAKVLVLGSLPSRKSIERNEYYAHPNNAFWSIMGALFGAGRDLPYRQRGKLLIANGIALWDVLAASLRRGSMDSGIDLATARPNDFRSFLASHRRIRLVCFNGQTAARMFRTLVLPGYPDWRSRLEFETLPSTSSAYAAMPFEEKLRKWSIVSRAAPHDSGEHPVASAAQSKSRRRKK